MCLLVEPSFCIFKLVIQVLGLSMEFFCVIFSVNFEHAMTFEKSLECVAGTDPHKGAIFRVKPRLGTCLVFSIFSFTLCSAFRICLYIMALFLERVEIRLIVFTIFLLHAGPLLVLSPLEILVSLLRVGLISPFFVMV